MEIIDSVLHIDNFFAVSLGIVVLFIGRRINSNVAILERFSIPEPVSGGLLISLLVAVFYYATSIEVQFDLETRDVLLVYFFTTIGINASLHDLKQGGKPLVILLAITIGYMILQNLTGIGIASLFGQSPAVGMLGGSVSLIGGHGTAIAWAPRIAEDYGISNAMEIGIASATFGLILASLMGGPIAQFLIKRHNLSADQSEPMDVGQSGKKDKAISSYDFLDAILAIHLCIFVGYLLNEALTHAGIQLPLFVSCLFAGIVLSALIPLAGKRITGTKWPAREPAVALIADMALGTFLAMSLMSMQLWTLVDMAGPIFAILAAQFLVAIAINLLVVFPAMGKNYDAAVICSGFGGISLGSTPTAMANMASVSQRYGNSHLAFIIVPLVCAFFIDIANAVMIPLFLQMG